MSTNKGTSLLEQTNTKKQKWGGDPHSFDIKGTIKSYDTNLAKYNDVNTSQAEKDAINKQYGGDITKWDNKTAYDDYMADLKYIDYVDNLNEGHNAVVNSARNTESQKMQYADTRRQLMQKYLPETLMAQGVANTGYTADALLKAENNYNQYVLGAMNERAATEQDAMQSYRDALGQFKQEQSEEAYGKFLEAQKEDKALYNAGIDLVNNATYDKTQLDMWLKSNGVSPDDETYKKVMDYYDSEKARYEEEIAKATEKTHVFNNATGAYRVDSDQGGKDYEYHRLEKGKVDRISLFDENNKEYIVKLSGIPDDATKLGVLKTAGDAKNLVVLYKDKLYYVDSIGNVSTVDRKGGNKGYDNIMKSLKEKAGTTTN